MAAGWTGDAESRSGNLGNRRDVLGFHLERGGRELRQTSWLWYQRTRSVENRRILKRHHRAATTTTTQLQRNNNNNGNNPVILRSLDFKSGLRESARVGAKRARNVKTSSSPPEFRSLRREKNATQLVGPSHVTLSSVHPEEVCW